MTLPDMAPDATPASSEAAPPAIDIGGLSLTFQTADGPVYALADVDLSVARGEFVSFIGPSGCGKTTLIRVVADLEQPTAGRVAVNGVSPHEARLGRAYGYVFQAPALYPWRTVEGSSRAACSSGSRSPARSPSSPSCC